MAQSLWKANSKRDDTKVYLTAGRTSQQRGSFTAAWIRNCSTLTNCWICRRTKEYSCKEVLLWLTHTKEYIRQWKGRSRYYMLYDMGEPWKPIHKAPHDVWRHGIHRTDTPAETAMAAETVDEIRAVLIVSRIWSHLANLWTCLWGNV